MNYRGDNRYEVNEAFKQSCKENVGLNRYGRIHVVEDDIDIVGENYNGQLVDFTIEDNCYINDTFIGTTVAKKITVNILNPNNFINLENKTIQAFVGIYIDGKLEEIPYGTYIIEKPDDEEVKEKTNFTGYDYMIKFNVPYTDRVKYPIKLSTLFEDVCNQVGLEAGNIDFINADYMVLGNPFTDNENCRTVLSNIAQLAGGFVKIGRDNKVYIIPLKKQSEISEKITGNNYFEDFSKNNYWGEVNSLVIGLSNIEGENTARDDKESIAKNGLTEITIEDNYFLINEEERNKVIDPLWEQLKGIRYLPFKTKYYGYPYIDSGDAIAVEDTKDIQYLSYVFNHTFIFNGAFDGNINTPAMTKTQTAYKNTQDIKTKFRRVERRVDKINGEMTDIIEEQKEITKNLNKSITNVSVMYALADSSEIAPTEKWSVIAPPWENGKYMWQKTVTTYIDNTIEESEPTCISGANGQSGKDGIGISSIIPQYYLSSSDVELLDGEWKDSQDEWQEGFYIWTRSKITWTNNDVSYTEAILATALNDANITANNAVKETTNRLAEQKITIDEITSKMSETTSNVNQLQNDVTTVKETVSSTEQRLGSFEINFEETTKNIQKDLTENIEIVKNMSYIFNTDDLQIAKKNDPVNSRINNSGMRVYSYDQLRAIFNDKGSGIQKLIVVGTAQLGNLQFVKNIDKNGDACTDIHHLISNIQALEDLEV